MREEEFREAYRTHKDVVYRFARRMLGSDGPAEEIVQDTFLQFWRKPWSYRADRGPLRSFLLGMARNLAWKHLRTRRGWSDLDEAEVDQPAVNGALERSVAVAQAIALLPPLQREAIILAEYEGLSLDEMRLVLGCELAAVKSRLHRARENLRAILRPLLAEERRSCESGRR